MCIAMFAFAQKLVNDYDSRALVYIACAYLGLKGGAGGMLRMALLPLFKSVATVSSTKFQVCIIVVSAPWAMKPIVGMADYYPIFGRTKQWYVIGAAVVGLAAAIAMAHGYDTLSPNSLIVLATLVSAQLAATDILSEGMYVGLMKENPAAGSSIVSYVWFLVTVAEILVALVAGPVADDGNVQLLLWAVAALCAQIIIPVAAGWMLDAPRTNPPKAQRWTIQMAVIIVTAAAVTAIASSHQLWHVQLVVSVAVVLTVVTASWVLLPPKLRVVSIFTFLVSAASARFTAALDYFYTASDLCVPNGPAFSLTFYLTVASVSSAACGVMGVLLYEMYLSHREYGYLFRLTIALRTLVSFVDVALVSRWTQLVHLSDKSVFLFGDACLGSVIDMMSAMAMAVITAQVCPKESECIVYAIIAGMQNLGSSVAALNGNIASLIAGVEFSAETCLYDQLPTALIVGTLVLPALIVPLTWWLPDRATLERDVDNAEGT